MKEATGELNMTVITVIAIAAIGVIFYTLVWPIIKNNINQSTKCANAICDECASGAKTTSCIYYEYDDEGNTTGTSNISCPCK